MPTDPRIVVYYGPLDWFRTESEADGASRTKTLLDQVHLYAEHNRKSSLFVTTTEGTPNTTRRIRKPKRASHVVAESGSFASLNELALVNFADFVRESRPKNLYLHNPPRSVVTQLQRVFADTTVRSYDYPTVNIDVLRRFRDEYNDTIIGQPDVCDRMLASLLPLTRDDHQRPVVVMFHGPSGVGKTETARFISRLLDGNLMRKQFSMFHTNKFASYLFGGEHSEGSLAKDLLDRESSVILFDEFDKAEEVFHSAFYELFDEGVFEDTTYRVEVGRAVIICTSNYTSEDEVRSAVGDAMFSRFSAVIEFTNLSADDLLIVINQLIVDRLNGLTDDERERIDAPDLHRRLLSELIGQHGNVRQLGKTIDEAVNSRLVDIILAQPPAPNTSSSSQLPTPDEPSVTAAEPDPASVPTNTMSA